jgi:hypothetical protein
LTVRSFSDTTERVTWRAWGSGDFVDRAPAAYWRVWADEVGTSNIPTERTVARWFERGFTLPTEQGSSWPGFFGRSENGLVTHVASAVAGLEQHRAEVAQLANERRGERMRAAKAAYRAQFLDVGCPGFFPADCPPVVVGPRALDFIASLSRR